jgi:hypothetical protein
MTSRLGAIVQITNFIILTSANQALILNITGNKVRTKRMTHTANFPCSTEFAERFPQYGPFARKEGKFLFDFIMEVKNYNRMQVFTESKFTAVTGVAGNCYKEVNRIGSVQFSGYIKQFIGAVRCCLMEFNNY